MLIVAQLVVQESPVDIHCRGCKTELASCRSKWVCKRGRCLAMVSVPAEVR